MIRKEQRTEARIKQPKEGFKSSFKSWIRAVAFIVVAVFLPEQVAQAVEYDWRVIWNKPVVGASTGYLANLNNINTALTIRNILKDVANKPVNSLKVSSNLTIKLDKPLKMSNQEIEELTEWLKGKSCGSKALYDYLNYTGIKASESDIAIMALTVDILNDVVKPEGSPKVIKNSLYALSQAAKFFGIDLSPVKIKPDAELNKLTPFIAHLNYDHYVLVTRVTGDKVYYSEEHKEEFFPKAAFMDKFSGYALTGMLVDSMNALTPEEAKRVLGARDSTWRPVNSQSQRSSFTKSYSTAINSTVLNMNSQANKQFMIGLLIGTATVGLGGLGSGVIKGVGTRIAVNVVVNESILQASSLATSGKLLGFTNSDNSINWGNVGIHAIVIGGGALSGAAPSIARLGTVASSAGKVASTAGRFTQAVASVASRAPRLAGFVGTVASQAALGGEIYLLTGLATDGITGYNSGKELTLDSVWGNYSKGLLVGGIAGAAFGGAAWAASSKVGAQLGTKIAGSNLGQALINSKTGQFIAASPRLLKTLSVAGRLAIPTVGGALVFPAAKTILEGDVSLQGFADSYSDPWNYLTGGIIGLGLGVGYTAIPKVPLSGVLGKEASLAASSAFKLGAKRFLYGGIVANAAGTGVNLLKGNYWDNNNEFNWNKLGIDTATYFAIGGVSALYLGKQGTNIVKGLQNYSGPTGGSNLYNIAVRGAAEWVAISPAFTVGGGLWEGIKAKAGYYGSGLTADSQALVDKMAWSDPSTWFLVKGNYIEEDGKMKLNMASLTGTDLLLSAVEGPRSGMWMKPLIGLAQVQTESPGLLGRTWGKVSGKITSKLGNKFGGFVAKHATLAKVLTYAQRGISWTYSSMIRMPGIVTAIDTGIGIVDDQLLKWSNPGVSLDDPTLYKQNGELNGIKTYERIGYMSKGMREYAKWLPFFMIPVRTPKNNDLNKLISNEKDMAEALKVLGLKPGASEKDIKIAFRQKAKTLHPDLHPNDALATAKMAEVNQAYAFLTGKATSFARANYNTTAAPSKDIVVNTSLVVRSGETRLVAYDPVFARTQLELSQGRMPTIWQPQQVNVVQAAQTTPAQPAVSALPAVKASTSTSLTVYDPVFAKTQTELAQRQIPTAWHAQNTLASNQLNALSQSILDGVNNLRNNPAAVPMFVPKRLKLFLAQEGLSEQEINGMSVEQAWARADAIFTAKGLIEPLETQPVEGTSPLRSEERR
ncbi:MAG: DnaJ domain-containing protein, partial [Dehalococcoidales bacterium]|nr:DnaJ domain-containing protein [Dehalococcoidales bacterium]